MWRFLLLSVLAFGPVTVFDARPAAAQDQSGSFRSPSDNIHCYYDASEGDLWLRCDMAEGKQTYTVPPEDCDLDWGMSFLISETGPAELTCHGDTVRDPRSAVLGYGAELVIGEIMCQSEKTGLTCRNGEGHGFHLAKAGQKIF
ncbi:DUF6636 domain-containing protein [Gemmobacter sp. 24YEA27]|uniref:DUF6636 domain-containing protein n=1 Tax=Gemmobacter sp. 24YEA27 TaxID=3040672 RepID=UPI0024B36B20|nr:DUF6636 domain-containing protein [Gemmobacter sp. 24YEA27]